MKTNLKARVLARLLTRLLTQLTLLNICFLRVYAYTDKSHRCFIASKASVALSKPACAGFDLPAAYRNISYGGQV